MRTGCEEIPVIIRAGMVGRNDAAMLTSKYDMVVKLVVGNTAPPFITDVSFIVLPFTIVITLVCCQRLTLSLCKVIVVISYS